jgi:hypothetical protein
LRCGTAHQISRRFTQFSAVVERSPAEVTSEQSARSAWRKQVIEIDPTIEFSPHQVAYSVDRFGAVVSGVDVHPEGARSLAHPNNPNNGPRNVCCILIWGCEVSELLGNLIH